MSKHLKSKQNKTMSNDVKPNQVENILVNISEMQDKMQDAKVILKNFKMDSDRLRQLKGAYKEMKAQLDEEKDRIEDEFYQDPSYEEAKNSELTLKNQMKEKNGELKQVMAKMKTEEQVSTYEYNIKGENQKLQVERVVKVYINGKEQK